MGGRRKRNGPGRAGPWRPGRRASRITVRRLPGQQALELVHPPCVGRRKEDLEEVYRILQAGQPEVAVDELRWLLRGCTEFLEAHLLLGQIALGEGNLPLARAHLGYAYELGLAAVGRGGGSGPLPRTLPANRPFFQAGQLLAQCLRRLDEPELAAEVDQRLAELDPGGGAEETPRAN